MSILLIIGILCIIGAAVLAVMAFLPGKDAASPAKVHEPMPAPEEDGEYVFKVEGMTSLSRIAAVEEALGKFETLTAEADSDEGTITISYEGAPDLKLLKAVKKAVEATGCKVSEIR